MGDCSDRFVNQGVRQRGILSTHLYKVYVHPLLVILKNKRLGFRLGTVYIGSPAVADNVSYLTRFKYELQLMCGEGSVFSARNRYQIHPTNTIVTTLSGKAEDGDPWTLEENEQVVSDRKHHLGITRARKKESEINISDRLSLARRTSYHLMNTGLHGTNVLKPETSYVIYKCDVISRMINGLEVICLTKAHSLINLKDIIFISFVKSKLYRKKRLVLQYACSRVHFLLRRKNMKETIEFIICSHQ